MRRRSGAAGRQLATSLRADDVEFADRGLTTQRVLALGEGVHMACGFLAREIERLHRAAVRQLALHYGVLVSGGGLHDSLPVMIPLGASFRQVSLHAVLLAAGCLAVGCDSRGGGEDTVLSRCGLLPDIESPYGGGSLENLERQGGALTEAERALLQRGNGGKWRTYSDELVEFEIPDDPLLDVSVMDFSERDKLRVVGGVMTSVDNSFERVYRLTFGAGRPYGLVLVKEAKWFDEGICLCGPIALKTFAETDGNLIEMSLLPDGRIKKFQALNGRHRAMLFEWTHSAITQEAYARIGASVRVKPPSGVTRDEWIAKSKEERGFEGALGWLRPEMPREEVAMLLGPATREDGRKSFYVEEEQPADDRGSRTTVKLAFEDGKLARFGEDWFHWESLPAPRGTFVWIRDRVREWSDLQDELPEGQYPDLPSDEVRLMLEGFHAHAPTASGEEWDEWCGVIAGLARLGVKDPAAARLAEERFQEQDLPQSQSRWVLDLYELPRAERLERERLTFLMGDGEAGAKFSGECHNLFASMSGPEGERALLAGMAHESEAIRGSAAYFIRRLEPGRAKEMLARLLVDESREVRRNAILNVSNVCATSDLEWLEPLRAAEADESNRKLFDREIGELKPRDTGAGQTAEE